MNIKELCVLYGSDKWIDACPTGHSYAGKLDEIFTEPEKITSVLEIGIGYPDLMKKYVSNYKTGPSLRVWREFFVNANIYGIDNVRECMIEDERIKTFLCDQNDSEGLKKIAKEVEPFDIIFDDGSHKIDDQISSAKSLLPYMKKGGYYFIEDIENPHRLIDEFPNGELFEWRVGDPKMTNDRLFMIRT